RVRGGAPPAARVAGRPDEAVHLAAADVRARVAEAVPGAAVHQAGVVIGLVTAAGTRIRHADRELPVLGGDAVRPRVRAEERVERPVLLHDDHDVPDLVDAGLGLTAAAAGAARAGGTGRTGGRGGR